MPSPLTRMLVSTFYSLRKDYGTTISFTKVGKGDVDNETGVRTGGDRTFPLPAIFVPVGHMTEWIANLLGRTEKVSTSFLIRVADIPAGIKIETDDYFTHANLTYRNLAFEDFDGVLIGVSGDTHT